MKDVFAFSALWTKGLVDALNVHFWSRKVWIHFVFQDEELVRTSKFQPLDPLVGDRAGNLDTRMTCFKPLWPEGDGLPVPGAVPHLVGVVVRVANHMVQPVRLRRA